MPGFTRAVFRSSAADPGADLERSRPRRPYVSQWREPDRAAACVALYRSFLTRELGEIASGEFRDRTMATPALQFVGVADPVIRPDEQAGVEEQRAAASSSSRSPDAGHWLPEEAPEALLEPMLELYAGPGAAVSDR